MLGGSDAGQVILGILIIIIVLIVLGWIVQLCWNYVIPQATGWNRITVSQGIVLLILIAILFGGHGSYLAGVLAGSKGTYTV